MTADFVEPSTTIKIIKIHAFFILVCETWTALSYVDITVRLRTLSWSFITRTCKLTTKLSNSAFYVIFTWLLYITDSLLLILFKAIENHSMYYMQQLLEWPLRKINLFLLVLENNGWMNILWGNHKSDTWDKIGEILHNNKAFMLYCEMGDHSNGTEC